MLIIVILICNHFQNYASSFGVQQKHSSDNTSYVYNCGFQLTAFQQISILMVIWIRKMKVVRYLLWKETCDKFYLQPPFQYCNLVHYLYVGCQYQVKLKVRVSIFTKPFTQVYFQVMSQKLLEYWKSPTLTEQFCHHSQSITNSSCVQYGISISGNLRFSLVYII